MKNRCIRCGGAVTDRRLNDHVCDECWRFLGWSRAKGAPAEKVTRPPGLPPAAPTTPAAGRWIPLGKREEAVVWLAAQLESGPLPAANVLRRAKAARITHKTLRRAKTVLGVRSVRLRGVGARGLWAWVFPREDRSGD